MNTSRSTSVLTNSVLTSRSSLEEELELDERRLDDDLELQLFPVTEGEVFRTRPDEILCSANERPAADSGRFGFERHTGVEKTISTLRDPNDGSRRFHNAHPFRVVFVFGPTNIYMCLYCFLSKIEPT